MLKALEIRNFSAVTCQSCSNDTAVTVFPVMTDTRASGDGLLWEVPRSAVRFRLCYRIAAVVLSMTPALSSSSFHEHDCVLPNDELFSVEGFCHKPSVRLSPACQAPGQC